MKKITFFINSLDAGGSERQLLYLVNLIKKKFIVEIFCFKKGELINDFKKQKVNIISEENSFFPIIPLIKYLLSNDSEIYHFILPKAYILGGIFTIFSKKKKIMSRKSLNNYHKKYFGISLFVEKLLHSRMDYIVCNSESIKKQLILFENVNTKKIKVIKNFFYNRKVIKSPRVDFKIKNKDINFAYVANFIPYKGHKDLIEICSKLKTKKKLEIVSCRKR